MRKNIINAQREQFVYSNIGESITKFYLLQIYNKKSYKNSIQKFQFTKIRVCSKHNFFEGGGWNKFPNFYILNTILWKGIKFSKFQIYIFKKKRETWTLKRFSLSLEVFKFFWIFELINLIYTYKYSSLDYYYRIIQKENLLKNLQKKFATQNFPL